MAGQFPQQWFLEIQGKRTGPFTPDQILGLFQDGEILADQKITSPTYNAGQWITVREFLEKLRGAMPHLVQSTPGRIQAGQSANPTDHTPEDRDATDALFNILQVARERRSSRVAPPKEGAWSKSPSSANNTGSTLWIFGSLITAACLGAFYIFGNKNQQDQSSQSSTTKSVVSEVLNATAASSNNQANPKSATAAGAHVATAPASTQPASISKPAAKPVGTSPTSSWAKPQVRPIIPAAKVKPKEAKTEHELERERERAREEKEQRDREEQERQARESHESGDQTPPGEDQNEGGRPGASPNGSRNPNIRIRKLEDQPASPANEEDPNAPPVQTE